MHSTIATNYNYQGMIKVRNFLLSFGISILLVMSVAQNSTAIRAQEDTCPGIVETALTSLDSNCSGTGRNQACYGNIYAIATTSGDSDDFTFESPGDIVNVSTIDTLTLSPMELDTGVWGVALLRLQANLPDTLPGQGVTLLLFGDTVLSANPFSGDTPSITPSPTPPPTITVIGNNINIRSGPSTSATVVGILSVESPLTADSRLEDGTWLRVQLEDGSYGWVYTAVVTIDGDVDGLNVVDPLDTPVTTEPADIRGPLQAFYFRSGIGDSQCVEAPDSGILVQTPQGIQTVTFTVNEVTIALGSTVFLQAEPNNIMLITVVEGRAIVTAADRTVTALAGTRLRIPLDENGTPAGPPALETYAVADVAELPVESLPGSITIAEPLDDEAFAAMSTIPVPGDWEMVYAVESVSCPDGIPVFFGAPIPVSFSGFDGDGPTQITWNVPTLDMILVEPGVYVSEYTNRIMSSGFSDAVQQGTVIGRITFYILAPDYIKGTEEKAYIYTDPRYTNCTGTTDFTITPVD